MLFNSRSLRNKTVGVTEFLSSNDCDLCCITEAWLKLKDKSLIAEIKSLGYNVLFKPRKGKRGGGVCILYKNFLDVKKCRLDMNYKTFELMEATVQSQHDLLRISVFYRTGQMSVASRTDFINELDDYLLSLSQKKGEK